VANEQIQKFQPDRTFYLRGFSGTGAAAALCQTSTTGFSVFGVFRDMADFCVLVVYDADNIFEHYSVRYLPDFNLSGLVLNFDLNYQGLQPIDSAKYSWIDWAQLDVIPAVGVPQQIKLWDYATLVSGAYSVAQGTYTFSAPGACYEYDRLTLFVNNTSFDFVANGGESAAAVAAFFAHYINQYDWSQFANSSVAVIALANGDQLTVKYARTGRVNVSGTAVTWTSDPNLPAGIKFPGIAAGSTLYISGVSYTVASVNSPTTLTLTSAAPTQTDVPYLAEYGGLDGNGLTVYIVPRTPNVNLQVDKTALPLSGGNSGNITWNIQLDFTALGLDSIRQAWFTFAPQLPSNSAYVDTEFTATFSNWQLSDPNNIATLQIAGSGSTRAGNADNSCSYSSSGWLVQAANNYWHGFARVTDVTGSTVSVTYACSQTHDLYLGTSLYSDRGMVGITLDGDTNTTLDCYLAVGSEVVTRRIVRTSVAPGTHVLTITLSNSKNATSSGHNFIFDYIEAAVPTPNIPDALVTYPNVSPALDFDTDATYKMSPQRLLWHLQKLGFRGHLNEYLGVFWWNQRKRSAATFHSAVVTVGGTITNNDYAEINIGGFVIRKSIISWDTVDTIAAHFVYYINSASVAMWAAVTGPGQFSIYPRTPNWGVSEFTVATYVSPNVAGAETLTYTGDINTGDPGIWQVDPSASNPLNFAIQQWHADLFSRVAAAGLLITTSFSMELVYPPDDGTVANAWAARFYDGTAVSTDTGFANLVSTQCSFIPNMTAYQQSVFTAMAGLQAAAGLTPWLQFGEFLWWFYSSMAQKVVSLSGTSSVTIGLTDPHGMSTGDRVVVTGVGGCTSANGTWTITVIDTMTFSIPVAPNAAWTTGGQVNGGSMAYYDAPTSAAAQTALGRPLHKFTCQDDDPTVNSGADATFLASRLKAHTDAISTAVLAQYPSAKFEILYPNDVNNPVCLLGFGGNGPQGGRLNATVNLPPQWLTQQGSGLDSFKVEALSWGSTYLNMDLANQAIVFALTAPLSWNTSNIAYLIPWFTGICSWPREFNLASTRGLQLINFWAYDHLALMSWPIPLPTSLERSFFEG
jgi:hypothetical protein